MTVAASGGGGSAAIEIAKTIGASRIIATTGSPCETTFLEKLGTSLVIDISKNNYLDLHLKETVRR